MFDPNHEDYFNWLVIAEHYRRNANRRPPQDTPDGEIFYIIDENDS